MSSLESVAGGANFPEQTMLLMDNMRIMSSVNGQAVSLCLQDTRVGEDWSRLRVLLYPEADLFWLCFNVANVDSFLNIRDIYLPEMRHHCPLTPFVLIGLASDLREGDSGQSCEKSGKGEYVSQEDAEALALRAGALCYAECSAKLGNGITELRQSSVNGVFGSQFKKNRNAENLARCVVL